MRSNYHRLEPGLLVLSAAAVAALALALALTTPRAFGATGAARAMAAVRATAAVRGAELVITGAGWGHGVGMSQEGALGYAERGWSYEQILAHYYAATELGQAPAGAYVKVLIGATVRRVALETYVRGVVSAEMPAGWPLAALEAQAVASRTYALTAHAGGSRFDVYADTRSQVYRGVAAETPASDTAVAATAGQIVTYGGRPAITYFFASSGGMTENVENAFPGAESEPWLRGVADPFDGGPLHRWKVTMSFATVAARLKGLIRGAFRGIGVLRRGFSPRIVSAQVVGTAGTTLVSGPELEARLGLYASWARFSVRSAPTITSPPEAGGQSTATSPASAATPAAHAAPAGSLGGVRAGSAAEEPSASPGAAGGGPQARSAATSGGVMAPA